MADSPYDRKKHHPCINKRKRESLTPKIHEYQNFFIFFLLPVATTASPDIAREVLNHPSPSSRRGVHFNSPFYAP